MESTLRNVSSAQIHVFDCITIGHCGLSSNLRSSEISKTVPGYYAKRMQTCAFGHHSVLSLFRSAHIPGVTSLTKISPLHFPHIFALETPTFVDVNFMLTQ